MKNLIVVLTFVTFAPSVIAQRWNSAFVGKPESRALYASNVSKSIQNAWEEEVTSKSKKEMLLDEIIFGSGLEKKVSASEEETATNNSATSNIDEIEEVLGIKEEITDPIKKRKVEILENNMLKAIQKPIVPSVEEEETNTNTVGNIDEVAEAKKSKTLLEKSSIKEKAVVVTRPQSGSGVKIEDIESDTVYAIPEIQAVFPNGTGAMISYIGNNIKVPENTGKAVKGKVFVRFMVSKIGELSKVYLVKGISEECNKEAIRVIKKMPNWVPAQQNGRNVNSWNILPIYFEIE